MKGILLAGGTGSRLWPVTMGVSKQLLPLFDKPLVHYPLATLMLSGIREIAIITTPRDQGAFKHLLGDGKDLGIDITYLVQEKPEGLAQAFIIAERFIGESNCALILGDNFFHGAGVGQSLKTFSEGVGAQIFAQKVIDPQNYGIVTFDAEGKAILIEEKPEFPVSNYAVPGLYFYDNSVIEIAKNIVPSSRGELEISAVNQEYLQAGKLNVRVLPRGTVWMDTGTFAALHDATSYVRAIQERQGTRIACLDEISFRNGWISKSQLLKNANSYLGSQTAQYLTDLAESLL